MQKPICSHFSCWFLFLMLLSGLLHATPDSNLQIHEKILGTNDDSYAVIREETDNMGTYWSDYRKVWLDEYSKNDGPDAKPKTILLLDQIIHRDIDTGKVTTTEEPLKNPGPLFSDLVSRYSLNETTSWTPEQIDTLEFNSKTGRIAYKSQCMAKADSDIHQGDGDRFHLVSVVEDANAIFLTIHTDIDAGSDGRLICVPPNVTRNVRALKRLDPVYLSIGSFKSAKEALDFKRNLDKDKKYAKSEWMVWSVVGADKNKLDYTVVLIDSKKVIRHGESNHVKQAGGAVLVPVVSEDFRELVVDEVP